MKALFLVFLTGCGVTLAEIETVGGLVSAARARCDVSQPACKAATACAATAAPVLLGTPTRAQLATALDKCKP